MFQACGPKIEVLCTNDTVDQTLLTKASTFDALQSPCNTKHVLAFKNTFELQNAAIQALPALIINLNDDGIVSERLTLG